MKTTLPKQVQTAVQQYFVRKQFSYSTGVCVCYIQFAGYTDTVCSYVESNSVRLIADDDTTSAVSPTRRGAHEESNSVRLLADDDTTSAVSPTRR